MEYTRQYVVDLLHDAGLLQLAEQSKQELPDPVEAEQLATWETRHGIFLDDLISRRGGGP